MMSDAIEYEETMMSDAIEYEDWEGRLRDALDVADALLWARIQEGGWATPEMARYAVSSHKRIESAKTDLRSIGEIHRIKRPKKEAQS
jgi:hypothetical protein